jgi:thiamine-phosphate pyrophosphorylase
MEPKLFLVAPEGLELAQLAACVEAAGDVASIVLPSSAISLASRFQSRGIAVLCNGLDDLSGDGVHLDAAADDVAAARKSLGKDKIIGAYCGASRHLAMEAGDAGADYVAFDQTGQSVGEPIVGWWSELFEIPCVAFEPVTPDQLDILLPQKPDFIRPSDSMWRGEEETKRVVSDLMRRITE